METEDAPSGNSQEQGSIWNFVKPILSAFILLIIGVIGTEKTVQHSIKGFLFNYVDSKQTVRYDESKVSSFTKCLVADFEANRNNWKTIDEDISNNIPMAVYDSMLKIDMERANGKIIFTTKYGGYDQEDWISYSNGIFKIAKSYREYGAEGYSLSETKYLIAQVRADTAKYQNAIFPVDRVVEISNQDAFYIKKKLGKSLTDELSHIKEMRKELAKQLQITHEMKVAFVKDSIAKAETTALHDKFYKTCSVK